MRFCWHFFFKKFYNIYRYNPIRECIRMRCYLSLLALRAMQLQPFYQNAYEGEVGETILQILNNDNPLINLELNDSLIDSIHEEFASKFFYIENYIIQLRKFIKILENHPDAIFVKDDSNKDKDLKNNNVLEFSNRSEIQHLIESGLTSSELLGAMRDSLNNLNIAKLKLQTTFFKFSEILETQIMNNLDSSSQLGRKVLRSSLGYYKDFPKNKNDYSKDDLKGFFSDINLYFNFSNKLNGVPAVISPVVSTRLLMKIKEIINQVSPYTLIIEDLANEVKVDPRQLLIIDRELRSELIPLPNINGECEPQEISTELHYFYFSRRPEFFHYLNSKALIDGERPVMAHKRQEQYYHVFNTLHKEDFNGFDEYLEILSSHHANETKIHYDDFYKDSNSGILDIIETMVSNFEYIYINYTNSLWHCTQKLKAHKFILEAEAGSH